MRKIQDVRRKRKQDWCRMLQYFCRRLQNYLERFEDDWIRFKDSLQEFHADAWEICSDFCNVRLHITEACRLLRYFNAKSCLFMWLLVGAASGFVPFYTYRQHLIVRLLYSSIASDVFLYVTKAMSQQRFGGELYTYMIVVQDVFLMISILALLAKARKAADNWHYISVVHALVLWLENLIQSLWGMGFANNPYGSNFVTWLVRFIERVNVLCFIISLCNRHNMRLVPAVQFRATMLPVEVYLFHSISRHINWIFI